MLNMKPFDNQVHKRSRMSFNLRRKSVNKEDFYTCKDIIQILATQAIIPLMQERRITEFVDSSAGDAYLSHFLKQNGMKCTFTNFDLHPNTKRFDDVRKKDFLRTKPYQQNGRTMIGFNPPFGSNGKLAQNFLLHAMDVWKADVIVFILPYIIASKSFTGYLKDVTQLPKNSFWTPDGYTFDYPAFFCVYRRTNNVASFNEGGKRPSKGKHLPCIISINQYQNVLKKEYTSETIILTRRIGNNCGKHGYVYKNGSWTEYRFAELIPETSSETLPQLTIGAFLQTIVKRTTSLMVVKEIIRKISDIRDERKFKRTISSQDIRDALS